MSCSDWQDPPGDVCIAIIQKLEFPDVARMALVSESWCFNTMDALRIQMTWLWLFSRRKESTLEISCKIPRGLLSDADAFQIELRLGEWVENFRCAIDAGAAPGTVVRYDIRSMMGFFPGKHCAGTMKARDIHADSTDEMSDDGETESDDDAPWWERRRNRMHRREAKTDQVELDIESAQRVVLLDSQRALQAVVTLIGPDDVAPFLQDAAQAAWPATLFRGRLPMSGCTLNKHSVLHRGTAQPEPACFASVLGSVIAGCAARDTWSAEQLAGVAMTQIQAAIPQYEWWLQQPTATAQAERRRVEQPVEVECKWEVRVLPKSGDNLCVGSALQERWNSQLSHPAWDLHKLVAPLVHSGHCSAATQLDILGLITSCYVRNLRAQHGAKTKELVVDEPPPPPPPLVALAEGEATAEGEGMEGEAGAHDAELSFSMLDEGERCIWAAWYLHYAFAESAAMHYDPSSYVSVEPSPKTIGRAAVLEAKLEIDCVVSIVMALGENDEAVLGMGGDCRQHDHWFATEAFLSAWAKAAQFPDAFCPAERSALITAISEKERVAAHIETHWRFADGEGGAAQPSSCDADLYAQEFMPPLQPLCVQWLSALARKGGLMT